MSKILTVADLTVEFNDGFTLENVSFTLDTGDGLAIVGPNGAGKSVLVRALLGMVPHHGVISWEPNIRIGYVPQKIDADRHLPITMNNLLHAKARILGISQHAIEETVQTVGLDKRILGTPVGHLSGGQFQRALVAFALLGKPNVLILDEPTASIDKPGEEQVYELIHRLQQQHKMTMILVSHDLSFVYRYATKVLCLNKFGLCFGSPEEALTPQVLEKLYGPHKYFHRYHDTNNNPHERRR